MTGWHSSHDRCLKPVPIRVILPPARRTQVRVRGGLRSGQRGRGAFIIFSSYFSANKCTSKLTCSSPSLASLFSLLASPHRHPIRAGAIISLVPHHFLARRPRALIVNA